MAKEVSVDIEIHKRLLETVKENVRSKQEKNKKKLKSHNDQKFKVGDKVWRQNIRSQQRKGGKLESSYLGPYTVTALKGKSADLQDQAGTLFKKINIDHLIMCIEEKERIPHWALKTKGTVTVLWLCMGVQPEMVTDALC